MLDRSIWFVLAALVICEVPALIFDVQWFQQVAGLKAGGPEHRRGLLSREALFRVVRQVIRLLLVSLPAVGLFLLLLVRWPGAAVSTLSPGLVVLLLLLAIAAGLVTLSICVAVGQVLWWLIQSWQDFRCMYFLPEDAEKVRLNGAQQGILAAARVYPDSLRHTDEGIELMLRAGSVIFKTKTFPKQQQFWRWQLTNDFALYCDLIRDGYTQGYQRFFAECRDAGDQLAEIRERLRQDQATHSERPLLDAYAQRYLQQFS